MISLDPSSMVSYVPDIAPNHSVNCLIRALDAYRTAVAPGHNASSIRFGSQIGTLSVCVADGYICRPIIVVFFGEEATAEDK